MFYYNKLYDILTGKIDIAGSALKCSIKELYGKNDKLKYIYFTTENGIPCLLHISDKHEVRVDSKKFLQLTKWEDDDLFGLNAVLAADSDFTIVKKIKPTSSPMGYIQFLNKLKPSLSSIQYKASLMTDEFLVVLNDEEEVETYRITGPRDKKLLIVMELESILKNFIPEIERVHLNLSKLIKDHNSEYWSSLLELLQKCSDKKIIKKGKDIDSSKFVEESIKLQSSYNAVKTALEYFEI
ncbi:MAG: hypothetical protein ACRDAQ_00835 [Cetobacterium sp.]